MKVASKFSDSKENYTAATPGSVHVTMNIIRNLTVVTATNLCRTFSVSAANSATHSCKLLVIGGGSGGCTVANKFARRFKAKDSVIVIEPCKDHYYQPLFTLIGGGVTGIEESCRQQKDLMDPRTMWIQDYASGIDPVKCRVETREGHVINYEYIVIAAGVEMSYDEVPGMYDALKDPHSAVSTIYTPDGCQKTWSDLQKFKGGEAIFTYPQSAIKCPGAPQKIAYLSDTYLTQKGLRSKSNITYVTCLPVLFGVKKYADELQKVAQRKNIIINRQQVLKEIRHDTKEVVFKCCENEKETLRRYDMLHVVPHQHPPEFVRSQKELTDSHGYLTVDKYTLQHTKHKNMYGIGDCTNTPNSKTAAAIAKQCYVLEKNLLSTMDKCRPMAKYDGYGACPLVTSYNTCILAEFVYGGVPHETMPFNQAKESIVAYYMKRHLFPFLYWQFMLKGYYHGPEFIRSIVNPLGW